MANPLLGQILGSVFGNAMRGRARSGPFGGGAPGGTAAGSAFGGRGALIAMLLPVAMQWVHRNGGIGAVVDRFRQKGYRQQADSWVSTGANHMLEPEAIDSVVGRDELSRLARQLGLPEQDVAHGFAEILPEMTDQLSPQGQIAPEADEALEGGMAELSNVLQEFGADSRA